MKKILMFTTALLISLSLVGCNFNKDKGVTEDAVDNGTEKDVGEENNGDVVDEETDKNTDTNNGDETRLEVAEDAADRVAELDEVDSATVIVTDNKAYAAVVLGDNKTADDNAADDNADTNTNGDEELNADLEEKIADKVREADKDIKNVYVSLNPDFVERMTGYESKINEGEPVEGFFEEFTESVRNVFPDSH